MAALSGGKQVKTLALLRAVSQNQEHLINVDFFSLGDCKKGCEGQLIKVKIN